MILSENDGAVYIPMILDGKVPRATGPPNIGSRNYSRPPVAVLAGRGYDKDTMKRPQMACKGKRGVRWLTVDITITPPGEISYPDHIAQRMIASLDNLAAKGELQGEGDHLY